MATAARELPSLALPIRSVANPQFIELAALFDSAGNRIANCQESWSDLIVRAVNCHAALLAAVHHLRVCRVCAEGDLKDCEGGMAALAVIRKAEGRDA